MKNFPNFAEDLACLWRNNSYCESWLGVFELEKRQVICKVLPTAVAGGAEVEKPVKDMKKSGEILILPPTWSQKVQVFY